MKEYILGIITPEEPFYYAHKTLGDIARKDIERIKRFSKKFNNPKCERMLSLYNKDKVAYIKDKYDIYDLHIEYRNGEFYVNNIDDNNVNSYILKECENYIVINVKEK